MEATREFTQTPLLFVSGVGCDASARNQKMNQRNARLQAEQHLVAKVREKEKHDAEEERREADRRSVERKRNVEFLVQQMREKEASVAREAEEERMMHMVQEERRRLYIDAGKRREDEQKTRLKHHNADLQQQIET